LRSGARATAEPPTPSVGVGGVVVGGGDFTLLIPFRLIDCAFDQQIQQISLIAVTEETGAVPLRPL
jgi:hypothetical protein